MFKLLVILFVIKLYARVNILKKLNRGNSFTDFTFSLFAKHLFLFCNDLVPVRTDLLFVEAAIEKYSTKIDVEKFRYELH